MDGWEAGTKEAFKGNLLPKPNFAPEPAARQGRCIPAQSLGLEQILILLERFEAEQKNGAGFYPSPQFYEFKHFLRTKPEKSH